MASILKCYEMNELNIMDKKLVKGFYTRNLNEYGYLARQKTSKSNSQRKSIVSEDKD